MSERVVILSISQARYATALMMRARDKRCRVFRLGGLVDKRWRQRLTPEVMKEVWRRADQ